MGRLEVFAGEEDGGGGARAWLEPFPDAGLEGGLAAPAARYEQREAVELAFIAALQHLPEQSQQATVRSLGSKRVRKLVERFMDAFERGDVEMILTMLSDDATFAMPPYAGWARGREAIAASWLMPGEPFEELRYLPTSANGQPAVAAYRWQGASFVPIALDVRVDRRGDGVQNARAV